MAENVAIFVDYDNVYWSLINTHNHHPDHDDPSKNLFTNLWEEYGMDNVRTFRVYADFEAITSNMTSLQKKRLQIRHVYSKGEVKNSSDIELSIDAIESTYKDESINCYVFVTADSDMIPVLSRMMYKGKRVEIYYLSEALSSSVNLESYVHRSQDLVSFLNIDVKEYDVNKYEENALNFIVDWQDKNYNNNKTLGKKWLKDDLVRSLSVPGNVASELIEHLLSEELIYEERKNVNGDSRTNLNLTKKGYKCIGKENEKLS